MCVRPVMSDSVQLSMGFSRQEHWRGLPFPSPGGLPDPGTKPGSPTAPVLTPLYHWATREAPCVLGQWEMSISHSPPVHRLTLCPHPKLTWLWEPTLLVRPCSNSGVPQKPLLSIPALESLILLEEAVNTRETEFTVTTSIMGFPGGSAGKESACNAGDLSLIPRLGRSPGEGKGYLLQIILAWRIPWIV